MPPYVTDAEIVVLGAGPAGAAAAIALARAGRRVLLLEREAAPRESVCGEFLGPDAAAALRALGLDLPTLGAVPIGALRVASGAREAQAALPFPAWGLPRRALDGALQDAAAAAGATLRRAAAALGAERRGDLWHVRLRDGAVAAPHLVLATGKHALRGHARAAAVGAVGLKLHLRGVDAASAVTLLPFAGGYAGLQPTPGGANLCAAVWDEPGAAAREAGAFLGRVAAGSALAARLLAAARPAWDRPLAVAGVPYGFRHRERGEGLYRVGDQAAVIPSFTGDGMAMALHSGLAAAAAILAGENPARFHAAWTRRVRGPMRWATAGGLLLRHAPGLLAAGAGALPAMAAMVARRTRITAPPRRRPAPAIFGPGV